MKGKHHSEETKRKISDAHKGKWHYQTTEERRKKSESLKRAYAEGRKSPASKGSFTVPIEKDDLINLYVNEKFSTARIGKLAGCSGGSIYNQLKYHRIPIRSRSEAADLVSFFKTHDPAIKGKSFEEFYGEEKGQEMRKAISAVHQGIPTEKWNHFLSFEPYTSDFNLSFKNRIRNRDNQVCMLCGKHREQIKTALAVHHINYDKLLSVPENCIALCKNCHTLTNFNRTHWVTFFQEKLSTTYGYAYENKKIVREAMQHVN
jgi:hypothetical protein